MLMSWSGRGGGVSRRWEGELHAEQVEEVRDTFHRDGRLAGIGEGLGVIAPLAVEKQQHP